MDSANQLEKQTESKMEPGLGLLLSKNTCRIGYASNGFGGNSERFYIYIIRGCIGFKAQGSGFTVQCRE